jgi:hypothetical protein
MPGFDLQWRQISTQGEDTLVVVVLRRVDAVGAMAIVG